MKHDVAKLSTDLGKLIAEDAQSLRELGWKEFVKSKRGRDNLGPLNFNYPAKRVLQQYNKHGVLVKLSTPAWSKAQLKDKLRGGPHKSCHKH